MQRIKLRMCVQVDYTIEIDPTDYNTITEAYEEVQQTFEDIEGVKTATIMRGISTDMNNSNIGELEYAKDTAEKILEGDFLGTKQKELINTIVFNLDKIDNELDKNYAKYLDNKSDNRLFKLLSSQTMINLGYFLDDIEWRKEEATPTDWKALRETWKEFFVAYLDTQKKPKQN